MSVPAPITIHELLAQDRPGWDRLWGAYLAFYQAELAPTVVDATWSRLLDGDSPMRGFVASDAGGLIGFAHVVFLPTTWSQAPHAYLQDLFVDPGGRRRGVGAALMKAAKRAAREAGVLRLTWLTQKDNEGARALYDKLGRKTGFIQYAAAV